ncbi:hypothetical protein Prudu_004973 [Prunus dulcis]|uniref:Uncharacterized protein n=1 Tax=Prunus dulcis TaxID=3755 RepID=A0A4Y1QWM4_PRUDU|nr:hypothetical protein Prudu_004973 [Prunus dulcis]
MRGNILPKFRSMAYRGRGRGGFGGGGGGFGYAIQVPFEDVDLPNVKDYQPCSDASMLSAERQNTEVERYSDRLKPKTTIRSGALFVMLELKGFPQELTGGSRAQQPGRKRVRWNPDSGPMRLILCFSVVIVIMMEKKRKKGKVRMKMNKKRRRRQKKTSVMMIIKRFNQDFDDDDDDFNMEDDGDGLYIQLLVICYKALALPGKDFGLI